MPVKKKATNQKKTTKTAAKAVKKTVKKVVKKAAPAKSKPAQPKKPVSKKVEARPVQKKAVPKRASDDKKAVQPVRGMKDILPKEEMYWKELYHRAESITNAYNFGFIETPKLEEASLFVRAVGKGTDVVEKEMYVFEDRDGSKLALRPEGTAAVARAYITHGMQSQPQPVKLWYYGPMFRHDRPQAGRYREFHQFSCETFGTRDPVIDAELIILAYNYLRDLGINAQVQINSIGSKEDRQNYIVELVAYLRSKRSYLSEESKKRITKNPLRVLDSKDEQDLAVLDDAPQIIDWLSEDSKNYFMAVLEYLDELGVPYNLNPKLVRGLDYYTDTVFEFYGEEGEGGAQSALGGGGRYDLLIEQLGGPATPACGFALGLERIVLVLKEKNKEHAILTDTSKAPIFFAQLGKQARQRALRLLEELRREKIFVHHNLGKPSLKVQLELANKYGVTHTLILGQKEVQDGTIIIRNMESGIQEIVDQKKLVHEVKKMLNR